MTLQSLVVCLWSAEGISLLVKCDERCAKLRKERNACEKVVLGHDRSTEEFDAFTVM